VKFAKVRIQKAFRTCTLGKNANFSNALCHSLPSNTRTQITLLKLGALNNDIADPIRFRNDINSKIFRVRVHSIMEGYDIRKQPLKVCDFS